MKGKRLCVAQFVAAMQLVVALVLLLVVAFGRGGDATILPALFVVVSLVQYGLVVDAKEHGHARR